MDSPASHRLRIGRTSISGQLYLLTTTVRNREPVFRDLRTARILVSQLRLAHEHAMAKSLPWVVMPDHLHWLVELQNASLDALMRQVKYRSTHLVNTALERRGALWQKGYHDRAVRCEENIKDVARYIVANPLRAGLADTVAEYPHWDAAWL